MFRSVDYFAPSSLLTLLRLFSLLIESLRGKDIIFVFFVRFFLKSVKVNVNVKDAGVEYFIDR